ncbi:Ribulose kinase [Pseudomonas syringae pv. actinidiae]|uniref:Ribulose kinase n=1 Tax=Pseudomonas syringae pv. actinidiae TaxID=103796 RepID=A0AAN4QCC3_PSESF|nr:Ribulose kinase [Pseudomonas syringae pv. actinidiae]
MCECFHSIYFAGAHGLGDLLDSNSSRLYASSKPSRVCLGTCLWQEHP